MGTTAVNQVIWHFRRIALRQDGAGLTDSELLEQYIARQEEAAFEALLHRHGPMVLGVCRRVLRNEADAEDAFQATFLVLVRRAASLRSPSTVSNWLLGHRKTENRGGDERRARSGVWRDGAGIFSERQDACRRGNRQKDQTMGHRNGKRSDDSAAVSLGLSTLWLLAFKPTLP